MSGVFDKIKKIRGRSFDELRVRGGQAIAAQLERRGFSSEARLPDDAAFQKLFDSEKLSANAVNQTKNFAATSDAGEFEAALLRHFRTRLAPRFFAAFDNVAAIRNEIKSRFAETSNDVIETAQRNADGRFDLLGYEDLSFGQPIDWHLEPEANKRTPLVHWSAIDYLSADVAGDKKIIWELNRHQYFANFGRAYILTGDESFARAFVAQLNSWMDANPPKSGINWASSLEVAFRAIAWLWAFYFFKDSPSLDAGTFARALKFLYVHARHLETYLSTYFSPNTHLTGEALGLFYIGALLPEFRRASQWRARGERILIGELARHVQPDGVYFEQSSYYHRYTADFYTHYVLLKQANRETVSDEIKAKLNSLFEHLMTITQPDGRTPFYGDDDGGRLIKLDGREPTDFRAALINGAIIYGRGDFKFVAGEASEENLWLHGARGLREFENIEAQPPSQLSRAFSDSGYFVMRDGWKQSGNYMLVDCGAHGTANCAHAHADALSFVMSAGGQAALVDAGTYTYTKSKSERDYFRSSHAHNTLTIDGESSSVPERAFQWSHIAEAKVESWITHRKFDFFAGEQNGFMRLENPAMQRRAILFLKNDYFILRDTVESSGEHRIRSHFHFAAGADVEDTAKRGAHESDDAQVLPALKMNADEREHLQIVALGNAAGAWRLEDGFVSSCYGAKREARIGIYESVGREEFELMTLLLPLAKDGEAKKYAVKKIAAHGGLACEIVCGAQRDYIVFGDAGKETTVEDSRGARVEIKSEIAWLRFVDDELQEAMAINAQYIRLSEYEIGYEDEACDFIYAHRVEGEWKIETSRRGKC